MLPGVKPRHSRRGFSPWRQSSACHHSSNALPGAAELGLPPVAGKASLGTDCSSSASQNFLFPNNCGSTEENAIFIPIEILCRRKRNPFWPLAAQLSAPRRPGFKPWCDKTIGNRSLHLPPRDGKMLAGGYPCSLSIPVSSWGSNKRPRPWKTADAKCLHFSQFCKLLLFRWPWKIYFFLCRKIINWVVSCHGCSIQFIAGFVSYCAGLHSQRPPGLRNIE